VAVELLEVVAPPAWMRDALCQEYPDVNFFPDKGDDVRPAQAVCARCAVFDDCYAYALEYPGMPGIWAGASARARRREHVAA
jgi:hypothetical protein